MHLLYQPTLHNFSANSLDDPLFQNKPSEGLRKASCLERRTWLYNQIDVMFHKYVAGCFSSLRKTKASVETQAEKVKTRLPLQKRWVYTFIYLC